MADNSWFIIYRRDLEELGFIELQIMIQLTARARWNGNKRDKKFKIDLEPGQFVFGEEELAKACHCSRNGIRNGIKSLEKTAQLRDISRTSKGTTGFIGESTRYQFDGVQQKVSAAPTNPPIPKPQPKPKEGNICPVKPDDSPLLGISKTLIEELNRQTGAGFRVNNAKTLKLISDRLAEPSPPTVDEMLAVVKVKCHEWKDDPKMSPYLRPQTLFNATNFESYLGAARAALEQEKRMAELFGGNSEE